MAQSHSRDYRDACEITGADAIFFFLHPKKPRIRAHIASLPIQPPHLTAAAIFIEACLKLCFLCRGEGELAAYQTGE